MRVTRRDVVRVLDSYATLLVLLLAGALCAYVLVGLLFAFLYLAVAELRDARLITLWVRQSEMS